MNTFHSNTHFPHAPPPPILIVKYRYSHCLASYQKVGQPGGGGGGGVKGVRVGDFAIFSLKN